MFNISVDKTHSLVTVKLSGMMPSAEVADYVEEVRRQFVLNQLRHYVMLIDISDCPIQSQATVGTMAEHMNKMPKASAIAIVTGSSLARMQVRRLFTQKYSRLVTTVQEGRSWVLHGIEPAEPPIHRAATVLYRGALADTAHGDDPGLELALRN